jgi:hypothetical protein
MRLMFTFILSCGVSLSFAQTNWTNIEKEINRDYNEKLITPAEWYLKLRKEAGSINSSFSLWVEKNEQIRSNSDKKIKLYFINNFQITAPNGNKYAQLYLENTTGDSVSIARIDATLANVQEYFYLNNKWTKGRKNGTSTCGNSYYNEKLATATRMVLNLNNDELVGGNKEVNYKIMITIGNEIIESNVIKVHLFSNQYKRLLSSL